MKTLITWFGNPPVKASSYVFILRFMAGSVFFWEGIMKFVFNNLGEGRFTKLGIPLAAEAAHFVGIVEIVGGLLLIAGYLTRYISLVFIIEMIVAILSTKISMFMGTYPLAMAPSPPHEGIWAVLHEVRSEFAQLMTCLFLLLAGPGKFSIDNLMRKKN
jgi:putative oxidoreductase